MRLLRLRFLVGVLAGTACHSSTSPSTTPTGTSTTATTYNLSVTGSSILTGLRERSQMTAMITNDDGTTQDVTKSSTWLSSDSSVATVTSKGVVTTVAPGATHLTAVYQTTTQGFDIAVAPITTTFTGTLQSSDNRNGTFTLIVYSAIDPTPNSVSAQVTGTLRIQDDTIAVTGFFESLTGAITFSGSEAAYRFNGAVANGALAASFTAPNEVSGVIASTSTTVS
jgi:Bacterial Ig-like domain (group 2)